LPVRLLLDGEPATSPPFTASGENVERISAVIISLVAELERYLPQPAHAGR
jgi:hypothetical protein